MRTTLPLGVLLFFCFYISQLLCVRTHLVLVHYGRGCVRFDTLLVVISTPLSLPWRPGLISFRLSLLHFHYYGRCVCVCVCVCAYPVRHPFDYHYFTFTMVRVRFDTLSSIIISLSLRCVSGSTPFRVSLFHFYYGVCPVRHPFEYHYFTFTTVCVRFDTLSSIIISLLLRCVSGSTPFQVSLFHFYYGVCLVRHPFEYHYFTFTTVCVRFDTLSITIISLLLGCVSGSTPFRLSLFHFYYRVCRVRHPFDYHYFTFTMVSVRFDYPFNCHYFVFSYGGVRFCHPFDLLSLREWVRIKLSVDTMGKKQTLCQGYYWP
jgi:hypothetical protein